MPKQQESIRTREQAAARLLDLSGHLSSSRFIHRPFDQTLRKPVMGGLEEIVGRLPELGYEPNSSVHELVYSALSTLSALSFDSDVPLPTRIATAKLLLDAALSLSTSAIPLPSPPPSSDRCIPVEILYLIFHYAINDEDAFDRRCTLNSLCATSTLWRKIALPTSRSELVITSPTEFSAGFSQHRYRESVDISFPLNLLHIDLSWAECKCRFEPIEQWEVEEGLQIQHLMLKLGADELPDDYTGWYMWAADLMGRAESYMVKMPTEAEMDYERAMVLSEKSARRGHDRIELFLGSSPVFLRSDLVVDRMQSLVQECLLGLHDWRQLPHFTSYAVLSTTWLPFTIPAFLVEFRQLPDDNERSATLSRLEHLELTLDLDPFNPAELNRQIDASKIAKLVLRLRLDSPHRTPLDETSFTDHFFDGLRSCQHLSHLELGGFGLSSHYLHRLADFPLSELVLLPSFPPQSLATLLGLLELASTASFVELKTLDVQNADEVSGWAEGQPSLRFLLERACEEKGILLVRHLWEDWSTEVEILEELVEEAGLV